MTTEPLPRDVFRLPGYLKFWSAESVSEFGTYITTIALQVLIVLTLSGTATDVGIVNASRWLPYLVFGLVLGALVDRRRRKPLLVGTDLIRGILLCLIPLLWLLEWLNLPILCVFVAIFGLMSLVNDAASQSFLPRLVEHRYLLAANARLDQSSAVAQTSGPIVGGGLVTLLGPPIAVLVDAVTYFFSAIVTSRITIEEPPPVKSKTRVHRDIAEGLRWVYRHRMLAPNALATHGWFLFNSMLVTVFVPFVLLALGLSAFELGIALAAAGVTGLIGALLSTRLGLRWGAGRTIIVCRLVQPVGWAIIALVPSDTWLVIVLLAIGQGLYGLAMGAENANEMGYRQAVTPDALQGRMNTTMRSINRAMIVIGAPLGGILADSIGYRETMWIAIAGFLLAVGGLAASPFRNARHGDTPESHAA